MTRLIFINGLHRLSVARELQELMPAAILVPNYLFTSPFTLLNVPSTLNRLAQNAAARGEATSCHGVQRGCREARGPVYVCRVGIRAGKGALEGFQEVEDFRKSSEWTLWYCQGRVSVGGGYGDQVGYEADDAKNSCQEDCRACRKIL
ncbi:hypothetical protein FDECE_17768 [Fusarium decemcellulare]|nr:hypothetical protein FDECE_17768 [Fusarium decemcellulare]